MTLNRTPRNIFGPVIKRVEAKLPERADGTEWRCGCGQDLFGIFKGGKLHIKYRDRTLFVDGVVRVRCRKCGNESMVDTVRVGGVVLHTTTDPDFLEKMREEMRVVDATPAAEKLAEEHGVNLRKVNGTGKNGRILKVDVEALLA